MVFHRLLWFYSGFSWFFYVLQFYFNCVFICVLFLLWSYGLIWFYGYQRFYYMLFHVMTCFYRHVIKNALTTKDALLCQNSSQYWWLLLDMLVQVSARKAFTCLQVGLMKKDMERRVSACKSYKTSMLWACNGYHQVPNATPRFISHDSDWWSSGAFPTSRICRHDGFTFGVSLLWIFPRALVLLLAAWFYPLNFENLNGRKVCKWEVGPCLSAPPFNTTTIYR